MKIDDVILINKYGQGLISDKELLDRFMLNDLTQKRNYLKGMIGLIGQSKPQDSDAETAILNSKLKPTFTPCILIKKGVASHNLQKLAELPEPELLKVLRIFLSLFKIAYQRRFLKEKNIPHKWWYWDLSLENNVQKILALNNT
ncbi:DUF5958 family protein [Filimonas effusa]|uniref:Uncharacterized protein n=1 Tax=Filimonas effusa TaxID=2508721 RepID=A0A4Q1DCG8_9BACT|nr:DUF5958 family protein [Filimonas effusa]RXK87214.1 hypothetical protein ESB13_10660 [Filimonas effusa]